MNKPIDVLDVVSKMTVEEKLLLLGGNTGWSFYGCDRLNIPSLKVNDGPHGVRVSRENVNEGEEGLEPATNFMTSSAMAATWNKDLVKKIGNVIGKECNYYGIDILLAPGVNGKRSPLSGRNFEYYSEDPYLTGIMATNFIQGVQEQGIGTSLKHFVCNEQETSRLFISSEIDERTLREIYLRPFEMAVKNANPWTIMASYNRINGTYGCENEYMLNSILKGEWNYDGVVISDWGAVNDKVESIKNGLEIEMGGPISITDDVWKAYESGYISEDIIDEHVIRILNMINKSLVKENITELDLDKHHRFAQQAAIESIVLLKNENNILPLKEKSKIAVIGAFANEDVRYNGGGSSYLRAYKIENPLDELSKYADVTYAKGYSEENVATEQLNEAKQISIDKDAVIIFTGTTKKMESEGYDRESFSIPEDHLELIKEISKINKNVIVILNSGSSVDVNSFNHEVQGILQAWFLGGACGEPLAQILFGKVSPSGRLSETFPVCIEQTPVYPHFPGQFEKTLYSEGLLVGYRYYDTKKIPVSYPFGYGLSFTTFEYSNLLIEKYEYRSDEIVKVSVDITNTGTYDSYEVVQLYIEDTESLHYRPKKELKDFDKVFIEKGKTKTVCFELNDQAFSYYMDDLKRFAVESGKFIIHIGTSIADIKLSSEINIISKDIIKPNLTLDFPLNMWIKHEEGKINQIYNMSRKAYWHELEPPIKKYIKTIEKEFSFDTHKHLELLNILFK